MYCSSVQCTQYTVCIRIQYRETSDLSVGQPAVDGTLVRYCCCTASRSFELKNYYLTLVVFKVPLKIGYVFRSRIRPGLGSLRIQVPYRSYKIRAHLIGLHSFGLRPDNWSHCTSLRQRHGLTPAPVRVLKNCDCLLLFCDFSGPIWHSR